jgi:hypothetical protein
MLGPRYDHFHDGYYTLFSICIYVFFIFLKDLFGEFDDKMV